MNRIVELLAFADRLANRIGNALRWLPLTVARLTVGVVFAQSGWGKLHDLAKVTDYFTELGLPAPAFQAMLASTTELVCGSLLLLGLATRFAAVPLMITMTVALRTALWSQIDSLGSLFGLAEFLYIALLLFLATNGAGPLSLDWLIGCVFSAPATTPSAARRTSTALA
ncbi:MAG: DoxX family protein [Deltaproteobacteria bacterium]|nr:DoxX family protein [Deltaproteobacteria bacterium]MBI3388161.1 DoxX family protein [Deltaproteobacteria bacterium]